MTGETVEDERRNVWKTSCLAWSKTLYVLALEAGSLWRVCYVSRGNVCFCESCNGGTLRQRVVVLRECESR